MLNVTKDYRRGFTRSIILRRLAIWLTQIAVFYCSIRAAVWVRFDFNVPSTYANALLVAIPVWIIVKTITFRAFGLLRGWWLYISTADILLLAVGNLTASILCFASVAWLKYAVLPRSIYVIDTMTCFLFTAGVRATVRIFAERKASSQPATSQKSTLIYGAGQAGLMLIREIHRNPKLHYRVRGFIDDDPAKRDLRICGVPVVGGADQLRAVVDRHRVEVVLVAIPSATGTEMSKILELCHSAGVDCRTVPGLAEMISGRALAGQIRQVAVEDLLGRSPVVLEEQQIRDSIKGKIILVTGAGGSIGSELCRQIARFSPAGIVAFELAESALFAIEADIRELYPDIPFYPEVGNIQNPLRLDEVFERYRPAAVYHAAAYKHVPLMETHIFEAVENNILGTYRVATAAIRAGVESFVLISSDKAVCPTNVMGATKRVAEQLLLNLKSEVKFVAVRFGNVLGSNGSVIPTFKKQILRGGPVTVTHPEMQRFFMTIPEACQLVLQAAAIADGGQICVLDMGEPVKIVDLAMKLILLSGLTPGKDIEIVFTGMRPGEKLNEELTSDLERTWPSSHEKIRIYSHTNQGDESPARWIKTLTEISRARDSGRLLLVLRELVPDYNPSSQLLRRAFTAHQNAVSESRYIESISAPSAVN